MWEKIDPFYLHLAGESSPGPFSCEADATTELPSSDGKREVLFQCLHILTPSDQNWHDNTRILPNGMPMHVDQTYPASDGEWLA